jgi:hypothetical protein
MLNQAIAIPTLVGSVLSMFAAGFIFLCYIVLPSQKHFRHKLILNLAFAGELDLNMRIWALLILATLYRLFQRPEQQHIWSLCLYAWVDTTWRCMLSEWLDGTMDGSGIRDLPGTRFNGEVLILTGNRLSILFISITTVLTLRKWNHEPKSHWAAKILVSMGIWALPTATSMHPRSSAY